MGGPKYFFCQVTCANRGLPTENGLVHPWLRLGPTLELVHIPGNSAATAEIYLLTCMIKVNKF